MEDRDVLISQETGTTAERRGPKFGARHVFAIMGFLGFVNVYAMRVNLSVAIVVMVNSTSDNNSSAYNNLTCPIPSEANSSHPDPDRVVPSQEVRHSTHRAVPWSKILTSIAVWAIIVAHCCQNWGFYTLLTELPTYMSRILHYNIKTNAFLSALPYLLMWIMSVLGSLVADFLRSREILSTTAVRKIANSLAFYIPALSLVCMSFVGCQRDAVLALLCVTVGMNGLNYSGFNSNHIDIASNYAGTLMGITNTLANFMGFLAPMAVGAIIEDHNDLPHWQTVFFISASVYFVGNTFFLIFGTGKEQPWNHHDEPTSEADGPHVGPILRISNDDIGGVDVY